MGEKPGIGGKPFTIILPSWSKAKYITMKKIEITLTSGSTYEIGDFIEMPFKESDKEPHFMRVIKVKTSNIYVLSDLTRWDKFKLWTDKQWYYIKLKLRDIGIVLHIKQRNG